MTPPCRTALPPRCGRRWLAGGLACLLAACLTSPAAATDARIATLGNQWFLEDDTNIFFNPATLLFYPDSVYITYAHAPGNATIDCDGFGDGTVTGALTVAAFGPGGCTGLMYSHTYGGGDFRVTDDIVAGLYVARDGNWKIHGELGNGFTAVLAAGLTGAAPFGTGGGVLANGNFHDGVLNDAPGVTGTSGATPFENPLDVLLAARVTDDIAAGVHVFFARGENRDVCRTDEFDRNPGEPCGATLGGVPVGQADAQLNSVEQNLTSHLWSVDAGVRGRFGRWKPDLWLDFSQLALHNDIAVDFTSASEPLDAALAQDFEAWRISAGARAWYELSPTFSLLPLAQYTYIRGDMRRSVNEDDVFDVFGVCGGACTATAVTDFEDDDVRVTYNAVEAGLALQYHADRILVTGSARGTWARTALDIRNPRLADANGVLVHDESSDALTHTTVMLPTVALGVEYAWRPMVTFRGGMESTTVFARESWEGVSDPDTSAAPEPAQKEQARDSVQATSADFGLGLHFGNLTLDTIIGGLVIGSGGGDYFHKVTFVYVFR